MATTAHGMVDFLADIPLYKKEKPYDLTIDLWHTPDAKPTNVRLSRRRIDIKNMSDSLSQYSADVQGFQIFRYPTTLSSQDFEDELLIRSKYYSECEALFKNEFGASQVYIFDHLVHSNYFTLCGKRLMPSRPAKRTRKSNLQESTRNKSDLDQRRDYTLVRKLDIKPQVPQV